MELTFSDLSNKDVVNVVDGKNLGHVTDIKLSFPKGIMVGIIVPGKKTNFFTNIFCRTQIYIDRRNIVKIGGDAILVKLGSNSHHDLDKPPKEKPCDPCLPCGEFKGKKDDDCEFDAFDL